MRVINLIIFPLQIVMVTMFLVSSNHHHATFVIALCNTINNNKALKIYMNNIKSKNEQETILI
jgi:hypothetical protein